MGYTWRDPEEKPYTITMRSEMIPDHIADVDAKILSEVIQCRHDGVCKHQCFKVFRITPDELQFYQKNMIPIPNLCSNCRHYERFALVPPPKLWHRQCVCGSTGSPQATSAHGHENQCPNEFETSYSPDRPEMVYCESCYQKEVL